MEYWSTEVLGSKHHSIIPLFHHSNTPQSGNFTAQLVTRSQAWRVILITRHAWRK